MMPVRVVFYQLSPEVLFLGGLLFGVVLGAAGVVALLASRGRAHG